MKLSELEEKARQEREEQQLLAAEQQLEKQIATEEAAEEFKQEVIAWMVAEGDLDATELEATLSVENHRTGAVRLSVPDHTEITFRVITEGEGYAVHNGSFEVERHGNYPYYAHSLGDTLLIAADEWAKGVEAEAKDARKEEERERARALREQQAVERGAKYLAMLDAHPILRPILSILNMVMEERERFAEDLYQAEEFYAGVEARYEEKLEQAQYEAQRLETERSDLQRDLWDAQDELREAERQDPKPGYSRHWGG